MTPKKELGTRAIETDVVVLGCGGAGAIAAIAAHDKGSRVIILEKEPKGGGATFLSNGGIFVPTSMEFSKYLYDICADGTLRRAGPFRHPAGTAGRAQRAAAVKDPQAMTPACPGSSIH